MTTSKLLASFSATRYQSSSAIPIGLLTRGPDDRVPIPLAKVATIRTGVNLQNVDYLSAQLPGIYFNNAMLGKKVAYVVSDGTKPIFENGRLDNYFWGNEEDYRGPASVEMSFEYGNPQAQGVASSTFEVWAVARISRSDAIDLERAGWRLSTADRIYLQVWGQEPPTLFYPGSRFGDIGIRLEP